MSLEELLTPRGRDYYLERLLSAYRNRNFPVDDWVPGSALRTILEANALGLADIDETASKLARGGYLQTAEGAWLDELARSQFSLERQRSTWTTGTVQLTAAPDAGPYEIQPGQLWLGTVDGLRFQSTNAVTLGQGGTATIRVKAEQAGAQYNVPPGAIAIMHTPLPGVRVENLDPWITSAGVDEETDDALRDRCRLRWADLGQGRRDAYLLWALSSHPAVTKATVLDQHPRGQGTVDVILWGEGGLGPEVVTTVDSKIQELRPISDDVNVYSADAVSTPVTAEVFVNPGRQAEAEAAVAANLAALQRNLAIGETLYRSAIINALMDSPHVFNAELASPTADVTVQAGEIIILNPDLTWTAA